MKFAGESVCTLEVVANSVGPSEPESPIRVPWQVRWIHWFGEYIAVRAKLPPDPTPPPGVVVRPNMFGVFCENVRSWRVPLPPSPPLSAVVVPPNMFGKCSGNVRNWWGPPSPPLPLRWLFPRKCSNVRNMFRNRSELGGPLSHSSPGAVDPPKMFGKRSVIVRRCWGASLPHLRLGGGSPGNVRRMFGEYSALVGVSSPPPSPLSRGRFPRKCSENVREMFGAGGCPLPAPPPVWCTPLKCSENVRKMSGTGGCPSPPLPRDGGSTENVRTMS